MKTLKPPSHHVVPVTRQDFDHKRAHYQRLCQLIYGPGSGDRKEKRGRASCRPGKHIRYLNLARFSDYLAYLESPRGKEELLHLEQAAAVPLQPS